MRPHRNAPTVRRFRQTVPSSCSGSQGFEIDAGTAPLGAALAGSGIQERSQTDQSRRIKADGSKQTDQSRRIKADGSRRTTLTTEEILNTHLGRTGEGQP